MPLTVVAYATAKKGKEEETLKVLQGLLAPTRAENGCLNYDLHQSRSNPAEFMFYENWTSQEALDAHLKTPHIAQFKARFDELLTEPVRISLYNPS